MGEVLGGYNIPIAQTDVAAVDFYHQNRLRAREFCEHFIQQTGQLGFRKGLDQIMKCPHLKALECVVCRGGGKNQKAVCIGFPKFLCRIHAA